MSKYIDFDRMAREAANETVTVKVCDTEYQLPVQLPAGVILRFMRVQEGSQITIEDLEPGGIIADVVDIIFGAGALESWLKKGITFDTITQIIQFISNGYQTTVEEPASMVEEGADTAPLTSSDTGQ
jgi:hypothetical protein